MVKVSSTYRNPSEGQILQNKYYNALIALKDTKSLTMLVVGIVMIFALVKLSEDSMIGRLLNTSSP